MKTKQFQTTLKCSGCVASLEPFLEAAPEIKSWEVDLESENKVLTVRGEDLNSKFVLSLLEKAGFQGNEIKKGIFKKVFG